MSYKEVESIDNVEAYETDKEKKLLDVFEIRLYLRRIVLN